MRIYKNEKPIGPEAMLCTTSLSQMRGLLFRPKKKKFCLLFSFKTPVQHGVHMWFIFYSIDVIFLNAEKEIIDIKEHFKPFSAYQPQKKYAHFIELPSGSAKAHALKIGDTLTWRP